MLNEVVLSIQSQIYTMFLQSMFQKPQKSSYGVILCLLLQLQSKSLHCQRQTRVDFGKKKYIYIYIYIYMLNKLLKNIICLLMYNFIRSMILQQEICRKHKFKAKKYNREIRYRINYGSITNEIQLRMIVL